MNNRPRNAEILFSTKIVNYSNDAVEAGRISREDAVKRYEAAEEGIKARMDGRSQRGSRRITREEYACAEAGEQGERRRRR